MEQFAKFKERYYFMSITFQVKNKRTTLNTFPSQETSLSCDHNTKRLPGNDLLVIFAN